MKENLYQFVDKMIQSHFTVSETLELVEKVYIEKMLSLHNQNVSATAKTMHVHRNTLMRKIKSLGIRE
jgi:transcriptional regulator with PAS, ATPase and Fis domain